MQRLFGLANVLISLLLWLISNGHWGAVDMVYFVNILRKSILLKKNVDNISTIFLKNNRVYTAEAHKLQMVGFRVRFAVNREKAGITLQAGSSLTWSWMKRRNSSALPMLAAFTNSSRFDMLTWRWEETAQNCQVTQHSDQTTRVSASLAQASERLAPMTERRSKHHSEPDCV